MAVTANFVEESPCDAVASLVLTSQSDANLEVIFNTAGSNGDLSIAFGDGQTEDVTTDTVTHTYADAGVYTVTLTATGTDDCTDTETKEVILYQPVAKSPIGAVTVEGLTPELELVGESIPDAIKNRLVKVHWQIYELPIDVDEKPIYEAQTDFTIESVDGEMVIAGLTLSVPKLVLSAKGGYEWKAQFEYVTEELSQWSESAEFQTPEDAVEPTTTITIGETELSLEGGDASSTAKALDALAINVEDDVNG
jgi:PKD repeat protein